MNMMKYNSYIARIEYDEEDRIFVGRLAGIEDIVSFHGATVDELETAFHESVDHYLEVSKRTGRPAQKPYSGNLMLRSTQTFMPLSQPPLKCRVKALINGLQKFWTRLLTFKPKPSVYRS